MNGGTWQRRTEVLWSNVANDQPVADRERRLAGA
jgi:hypothetical protein